MSTLKTPKSEETQILQLASDPGPNPQEPITRNSPHYIVTTTPEPGFNSFLLSSNDNVKNTVLGLAYVLLLCSLYFRTFSDVLISETLHDSVPLRVPISYSSQSTSYSPAFIGAICVAVIFGSIHCVVWSFPPRKISVENLSGISNRRDNRTLVIASESLTLTVTIGQT